MDIVVAEPGKVIRSAPRVFTLIGKGINKELQVQFLPTHQYELVVSRIVKAGDLCQSIDVACTNGMIKPSGICTSLRKKAAAADVSLGRGGASAARNQLQAFLNELKAQGGKHIKEPALTILREEAEALLKSVAPAKVPPAKKGKKV